MEFEQVYLSNRILIERTAMQVCRRSRTSATDAEDFVSAVHVHLIADNYAVLRAYQGRGDLGAFLQAVIRRLFQDWRNAHWGRWRPSASVRRQGPLAVALETLLVRDRLPLDQAIEVLRTNHGVEESPQDIERLASGFPPRTMREFVSDEALTSMPSTSAPEEEVAMSATAWRVMSALDQCLADLSCQDRLILRMRFEDNVPVSSISRVLGLDQTQLYRRVHRLLREVRSALEAAGVQAQEAREVLAARGLFLLERVEPEPVQPQPVQPQPVQPRDVHQGRDA